MPSRGLLVTSFPPAIPFTMVGNQSLTCMSCRLTVPRSSHGIRGLWTNPTPRIPPSQRVLLPPRRGQLFPTDRGFGRPPLSAWRKKRNERVELNRSWIHSNVFKKSSEECGEDFFLFSQRCNAVASSPYMTHQRNFSELLFTVNKQQWARIINDDWKCCFNRLYIHVCNQ